MNRKHVLIQIVIAITITFVWFMLSLGAWETHHTHVALYLLIAFLSTICSATIAVQRRLLKDEYHTVLHNAMIYTSLVYLANAIYLVFFPDAISDSGSFPILLDDLYFLLTFSLLILSGVLVKKSNWSKKNVDIFIIGSVITGFFFHTLFYMFVLQGSLFILFVGNGLFIGILAGTFLSIAGIIWSLIPTDRIEYNKPQMTIGFGVFGVSWIPVVLSAFVGDFYWTFAYPLRAFGLLFVLLAISIPFLKKVGMLQIRAYLLVLSIALLGFVPVMVTVASYVIFPGLLIENIPLYQMSHLGASVLLIVIGFLFFTYARGKQEWNRYPILFLYMAWTVIEFYVLISSIVSPSTSQYISLVPYIIGGLLSLFTLPIAIRWSLQKPKHLGKPTIEFLTAIGPVTTLVILIIAQILETIFLESFVTRGDLPISRGLLITINLMVLFAYTYLAILLVNRVKGRIGVDMVAVGALLLWIVPVMLKGNHTAFTIGWWASELFLLGGLLGGPAILGLLYIKELTRAEKEQMRATLFADLLVHDISNYHQAITVCLGLLQEDALTTLSKKDVIQDAVYELERADYLVRNVRRLGMAEQLSRDSLIAVDIVESVQKSVEIVSKNSFAEGFEFRIQEANDEIYTYANILLVDVFNNILLNSVKYSPNEKIVEINFEEIVRSGREYHRISFIDHGQGIPDSLKEKLFRRYMDGAHGCGLGLAVVRALVKAFDGEIRIRNRIQDDYQKGTIVMIDLPKFTINS